MFIFRLLLKNAFRRRLRTLLAMVGPVVAVCAFGRLRSIVDTETEKAFQLSFAATSEAMTEAVLGTTFALQFGAALFVGLVADAWPA